MLRQSYELYLYYQSLMQDCDKQIEPIVKDYLKLLQTGDETPKPCTRAKKTKAGKNAVSIDVENILPDYGV